METLDKRVKRFYSNLYISEIDNFLREYEFIDKFNPFNLIPDTNDKKNTISLSIDISRFDKIKSYSKNGQSTHDVITYFLEVMHNYVAPKWEKVGLDSIELIIDVQYDFFTIQTYRFGTNKINWLGDKNNEVRFRYDDIARANFFHYLYNSDLFSPRESGQTTKDSFLQLIEFISSPNSFYYRGQYLILLEYEHDTKMIVEIFETSELFQNFKKMYRIDQVKDKSVIIKNLTSNLLLEEEFINDAVISFLKSRELLSF